MFVNVNNINLMEAVLFLLFWHLLEHRSNPSSFTGKSWGVSWSPRLVRLYGCRDCHSLFICGCFDDSFLFSYVSCRFQFLYVKILTSILSSIISSSHFSSSNSKLPVTLSFDCAGCTQGPLVFLTGQIMTSSSKLSTRSLSLLPYVLDSSTTSSCNSLPPPNACFKTRFLST